MKIIATKYVAMNPHRCAACWECVEKCPKNVIGKVCFLWHKHAVFKNADACIGCNKCIKTCPHGVFFKPDETTRSIPTLAEMKTSFTIERLLPLAFAATAVTGIGLHMTGHGIGREVWHDWAAAHGASGFLWLVSGAFHIKRHLHWYKTIVSRGIGRKSRITLALSAAFLVAAITGIVLTACADGANSAIHKKKNERVKVEYRTG